MRTRTRTTFQLSGFFPIERFWMKWALFLLETGKSGKKCPRKTQVYTHKQTNTQTTPHAQTYTHTQRSAKNCTRSVSSGPFSLGAWIGIGLFSYSGPIVLWFPCNQFSQNLTFWVLNFRLFRKTILVPFGACTKGVVTFLVCHPLDRK